MSCLFCSSSSSITTFLVCHFNSPVSFAIYFFSILSAAPVIRIDILIYNSLVLMNNNFSRIHCAPFLLPSFVPLLSYKLHLYFMTTGTNIQFLLYAVAFYMGGEIELQTIIHVHCLLCLPLEFPLPVLLISSCRGERVGGEERNRRSVEFSNTLEKWVCVPLPAPPLLLSCLEETSDGDRFRNTLGCSLTSSAARLFLLLCLSQS